MKSVVTVLPLLAAILTATTACSATAPAREPWIDALITQYQAEPVANPPHRILQYRYLDETVYYVPPSCCDRPGTLYNDMGKVICSPDGGMTGRGDGRCADFHDRRSEESLIWSDVRTR